MVADGVLGACSLFVGIDSGLMHLAAALDLPVVALFGPTDPGLTGPRCSACAIVRRPLACRPCHDRSCRSRECMDSIEPDHVLDAVARVLPVSRGQCRRSPRRDKETAGSQGLHTA
jgi:ADP-heptose:LPS heptosyltransferase